MKFNQTKKTIAERTETTNHEGGQAFSPEDPRLELTKVVINNLLEDSFYESDNESFQNVEQAFEECANKYPEFILKLGKYARQSENLRQIPQALLVLSVEDERTREFAEDYARGIMSRTDEPLDVLALWESRNGTSIPGVLKRSIEDAMHQWNEWQYAKWDQPNKEWQYRDLMNLVHPKPRDDERDEIFQKIVKGDLDDYDVEPLKQEDTWESALSDDSDERSKAERYREQLDEGNMGLFPRIRQCRDMLESGVSAETIFAEVTDEWIRNSRLYPFRFYQSYKAVRDSTDVPASEERDALAFLERAMKVSTDNLPDSLENSFVAVDTSGSMKSPVSTDSSLDCIEISSLFGALVYERGADLAAFASDIQQFHGDRRDTIMSNVQNIRSMPVGGGTNGYLIPQALRQNGRDEYEQIIVFTDMQLWNNSVFGDSATFREEWNKYKQFNPDASLYLVDLQNYGDLVTPEGAQDVYNISGWTENVANFIDNMENVDGMIREIESVEPDE
jgi:60 kDa SS-A/Ro ribonucleoprotein